LKIKIIVVIIDMIDDNIRGG
jgi:hypothetical protein